MPSLETNVTFISFVVTDSSAFCSLFLKQVSFTINKLQSDVRSESGKFWFAHISQICLGPGCLLQSDILGNKLTTKEICL